MSHRATGFLLSVVLAAVVYLQPASAQQPPPGYQLLTAPQASGGLLVTQRQAVGSAVQLLRQGFQEIAPFFDHRPEAVGAYTDTGDQYAQAGFLAISRQTVLNGVAFAIITGGGGTLGFAFDSPQTLRQSLPRLLGLIGGPTSAPQGACPPPPQRWQVQPFPDGSGQIQLPEGWRITSAQQGIVTAEGPQGMINRGQQVTLMTRAGAAQSYTRVPFPVVDPIDPITPLLAAWAYAAAFNQQQGLPSLRVRRVLAVSPAEPQAGFLHHALVDLEVDTPMGLYHALSHILVSAIMPGGLYLYHESNAMAPVACFNAHLPTLMQILGSAQTASHVVRERFERARRSQQEAHDIWWDVTQNRNRSLDRIYADWTENRRGTRVFEDTETGTRRDAPLAYSADLVRELNREEGRERYREIPLRDLNQ